MLLLTRPWAGGADPVGIAFALAATACWAAYILLAQQAGDEVTGVRGLSISMPVAALVATVVVGPQSWGRVTPDLLLVCLLMLGQVPGLAAVAGMACVVAAGVGAERSGAREEQPLALDHPGDPVAEVARAC